VSTAIEWYRGFTVALVALAPYEEDTIFDDVVENCGDVEALIDRARKDGAMRWSGLSGYVRRR
jgi:hypothetical protein